MKRCPQCEFVYEEGQRLCDMDGTELVHDPLEIPANHLPKRKKAMMSLVQLLAMALPAVLLSTLVFFGSSGQIAESSDSELNTAPTLNHTQSQPTTYSTVKAAAAPDTVDKVPNQLNGNKRGQLSAEDSDRRSLIEDSSQGPKTVPPAASQASEKQESRRTKPARAVRDRNWERSQPQKKDSRIGSLLKKTGRFLKKPFQM